MDIINFNNTIMSVIGFPGINIIIIAIKFYFSIVR